MLVSRVVRAPFRIFNRPGVARLFYKQLCCSLIDWLINWVKSSFVEVSLEHLHSQIVRARELKFWEKDHLHPPVMCHMSCVTCHVSSVTCHMSHVFFLSFFLSFLSKVVTLVGGGPVIISTWLPCLGINWPSIKKSTLRVMPYIMQDKYVV